MSKTLKIILVLSILLNVLFAGVIIGHVSTKAYKYGGRHHGFWKAMAGLPEDKKELLKDKMQEMRREGKATRKAIHDKRAELIGVLTAPEFDETLFDQKVEELHEIHGQMAKNLAEATKELAKKFNQEERKALGVLLKRHPKHRGHWKYKDPPPGDLPERD